MFTTQTYKLNVTPGVVGPVIHLSQYDKGGDGRKIEFQLFNADGTKFEIPADTTITVRGTKPDKTGFEYPCSNGTYDVGFVIEEQMSVLAGLIPCEIRFVKSGSVLGTVNFTLAVEPSPLADDTIISETDLPLLEEAEQNAARAENFAGQAQSYASDAQTALSDLLTAFDDAFIIRAYNANYTINANSYVNLTESDFGIWGNVPDGYKSIGFAAVYSGNHMAIPFRQVASAGYSTSSIVLGLANNSSSQITGTATVTYLYAKSNYINT